jgi:spermidine dehydrogenase
MSDDKLQQPSSAPGLTPEERALGMDRDITRRDFLNSVAVGAGASLLGMTAPGAGQVMQRLQGSQQVPPWHPWTGYAGVGDYARSNGNTWDVITNAHAMRDGKLDPRLLAVRPTGEIYDLVVVGGGFAGITAAYFFQQETKGRRTCLVLDNHSLVGGEAKRNEFVVNGQRLIGPQGSNDTDAPAPSDGWRGKMWQDLGLPTEFTYGRMGSHRRSMEFAPDNYIYQLWSDDFENHGFFFESPKPHWVRNPWGHDLAGTPWAEDVRRDLLRWRRESAEPFKGTADEMKRWLDTMTYEQYLTNVRKLHPEVARYADPLLASAVGLGSDVLSANAAYYDFLPGFQGIAPSTTNRVLDMRSSKLADMRGVEGFPGGNDAILRCFVKALIPAAYRGSASFADVHNRGINFAALDAGNQPCRIRAGSTVVSVNAKYEGTRSGDPVTVTYLRDGRLQSVQARTVVVASGAWAAKHVVQNLPDDYREALQRFPKSPMLVVNVALTNWRFLYELGFTACSWRGGFGYTCNMRSNMYVGDYRPPLDPDKPNLLTFYVPFQEPGLALEEQGHRGRQKLLSTTYRDYERTILEQLVKLFDSGGFDPKRDVAGIVLNRWGHAYVNPGPGFYYGRDGQPAPGAVLRQSVGPVAFAHSEMAGNQNWMEATTEGRRAAQQVSSML